MNKTPRLSKSGIEYLGYQWGIFSGCHNWWNGICQIENCWAKSFAQRFKNIYPSGFEPTFYPEAINSPKHLKKSSIIGVGWVGDVIGYGLAFREQIFGTIEQCSQHRFLFLTKNPDRLITWGEFPDNCWVGVTATNTNKTMIAMKYLIAVKAKVKFISFEPLLERIRPRFGGINLYWDTLDWIIIGACTGALNDLKPTAMKYPDLALMPYGKRWALQPKLEWVEEIVEAASKAGIQVFLKNNLEPLLRQSYETFGDLNSKLVRAIKYPSWEWELRQEMPLTKEERRPE